MPYTNAEKQQRYRNRQKQREAEINTFLHALANIKYLSIQDIARLSNHLIQKHKLEKP